MAWLLSRIFYSLQPRHNSLRPHPSPTCQWRYLFEKNKVTYVLYLELTY